MVSVLAAQVSPLPDDWIIRWSSIVPGFTVKEPLCVNVTPLWLSVQLTVKAVVPAGVVAEVVSVSVEVVVPTELKVREAGLKAQVTPVGKVGAIVKGQFVVLWPTPVVVPVMV